MPSSDPQDLKSVVKQALEAERRSPKALRAFIYNRTSSDPHKRRTSTRDQETENRRTCEDHGWVVAGVFEDTDLSASRHAKKPRPDFDAMVAGVESGACDVIVFWDSSRGYRDLEVYVRLRKLCVEHRVLLCYNGDVYDMSRRADRTRSARDAVENEDESDKIRDRVLRTKRLSAERGDPVGRVPYGFRRDYDPKSGHLIGQVPDPETSALVREAAERVMAGEALSKIAADFQARGIPTARDAVNGWKAPSVRSILLNPAVAGRRVHQGAVVGPAAWDPILDEVTFRVVQRKLADPARRTQHDVAVKHLLSGIAKCFCGEVLRPVKNNGRLNYVCSGAFCSAMPVARLDDYVVAASLRKMSGPEFVAALRADDGSVALADAVREMEELEAELREAAELVGARKLTVASLAKVEAQLLPQLERARARVQDAARPSLLAAIAGPSVWAAWDGMDIPQRRAVLRELVRVTLNKASRRGVRVIEPGRIVLEWLR